MEEDAALKLSGILNGAGYTAVVAPAENHMGNATHSVVTSCGPMSIGRIPGVQASALRIIKVDNGSFII